MILLFQIVELHGYLWNCKQHTLTSKITTHMLYLLIEKATESGPGSISSVSLHHFFSRQKLIEYFNSWLKPMGQPLHDFDTDETKFNYFIGNYDYEFEVMSIDVYAPLHDTIDSLRMQSFEGWTEDETKGYLTALTTIYNKFNK